LLAIWHVVLQAFSLVEVILVARPPAVLIRVLVRQQASLTHVSGSARGVDFATRVDAPLSIRCAPKFPFARCAEATGIIDAEVRTARRMLNALVFTILFGCRFDKRFDKALYFVTHRSGRKPLKKWIIFPQSWDFLKKID